MSMKIEQRNKDISIVIADGAQLIREYVEDHWKHFQYFPMEVEIADGVVLNWDEYWQILNGNGITFTSLNRYL